MRFLFYLGWCLVGAAFSEVLFDAEESGTETPQGSETFASGKECNGCVCVRNASPDGMEAKEAKELKSH